MNAPAVIKLAAVRSNKKRIKIIQSVVIALRVCDREVSVRTVQAAIKTLRGASFKSDFIRSVLADHNYFHDSRHSETHPGHSKGSFSLTKSDDETQRVPTCARTFKEKRTEEDIAADAAPSGRIRETTEETMAQKIHRSTKRKVSKAEELRGDQEVSPERKQKSPRDEAIDMLIRWYGDQTWGQLDRTRSAREKWGVILDLARGDVEKVKSIAIEARRNKHLVLNAEFPTFTLHSIWFYARYRYKNQDAEASEEINAVAGRRLRELLDAETIDASRVKQIIRMFNVRWDQVLRAFGESDTRLLRAAVGDEARGEDRRDTA